MAGVRFVTRRLTTVLFSCVMLGVLAVGAVAKQSPGEPSPGATQTAQDVVAHLVSRNSALTSYQAHVDIRLHTGIPFLNPAFEGTTYFKQPDRHEIVFTKAPGYARGFEKLYSDVSDPSVWDKRFFYSLDGERTIEHHSDLVLKLVERVRGSLDHEDVLVDPHRWVIDEIDYYYYSGGRITVDQTYHNEGAFAVLDWEHAYIAMPPFPHARADAHYTQYKVNVAIDDAIFTEDQTKHIGVDSKDPKDARQ
jgi:hypothetical protein